jgi:hypothetical protein
MLKIGQKVQVEPRHPEAIGRGEGIVTHAGNLLAMVKFPNIKGRGKDGAVACFAADCKVIDDHDSQ